MEIGVSNFENRARRLTIVGDLDISGAERLDLPLATLAGAGGDLVVDMTRLDGIGAIGIRHLLYAAGALRRDCGHLVLLGPNPLVINKLISARVDDLLPIMRSEDEVYDALGSSNVRDGHTCHSLKGLSSEQATAGRTEAPLELAYRIIGGKKFIDLTQSFSPDTPVWQGFGQAKMTPASDPKTHEPYTMEKDGFRTTYYEMVGQYGTHVDPPAHFAPNGATMDNIPLKQMILRLVVLDDTPYLQRDPNHAFSLADLRAWERRHGPVPKGAFAALRTDMYKDWDKDPEHFKRRPFPAWSLETVKFLFEHRGVTAIGHESMDTDITDSLDSETYLLRQGHFQIEVMSNLDQVPATGALIVVTWPKEKGGLGFPARAFAILP